jgi:shikimate 5-dehydrogenase
LAANVTMPHKVAAFALSEPDEGARAVGAVEQRGLRNSDGLDMLLYQAVRGFSLWFGLSRRSPKSCAICWPPM